MAIASAEAIEPEIYVMDEPSANLDTDSTERLGNTIRKLKEKGKTILIAEHRLYYLMPIADRFLYIKDGRIMHEFTQAEIRQLAAEEIRKLGLRNPDLHTVTCSHMPLENNSDVILEVWQVSGCRPYQHFLQERRIYRYHRFQWDGEKYNGKNALRIIKRRFRPCYSVWK